MPVALTRTVSFRARHHYWRADWTAERNREVYGTLADPAGHAHDYRCAVTLTGPVDPPSGGVVDLGDLDRLLAEEIGPLDGADLNAVLPDVATGATQPTCEVLALHLFARIARRLPAGIRLARVRVAEDATLHADCTGLP